MTIMGDTESVARRVQRATIDWLERVFFGGAELAALSTPAFAVVLVAQTAYPDAIPIAGLLALTTGSLGLALFRGKAIDVGEWPRRGELATLPLRVGYFSAVFLLASAGVGVVAVTLGSLWFTLLGGVLQPLGLAAFPRVYRVVHGDPLQHPAAQV